MSLSRVEALQKRIEQLEADNASLSAAATEAASLAEEYAHDAAQYRQGDTADAALVTELKDATRRKDRRIARLSNLLQQEKEQRGEMEKKVRELEECLEIADEMVEVMNKTIVELKERDGNDGDSRKIEHVRVIEDGVNETMWNVVRSYLPERVDVEGDFAAIGVLRSGMSCCGVVGRIREKLGGFGFERLKHEFGNVLEEAEEGIANVIRWIFTGNKLKYRAERVGEVMSGLESCLYSFLKEVDGGWSEGLANMRKEVIGIAIERVVDAADGGLGGKDALKHAMGFLEERAQKVRCELGGEDTEVLHRQLERKVKEVEDGLVKIAVFEERVKKGVKDEEEVKALQSKLKEKEEEVDLLKEQVREVLMAAQERKEEKEQVDVDEVGEADRLRRVLVRRYLADVLAGNDSEQDESTKGNSWSEQWREKWNEMATARNDWTAPKIIRLDGAGG